VRRNQDDDSNSGDATMPTAYIACNNCRERGYFLGDVLGMIKVAWLWAENERYDKYLLSVHRSEPLNFLWQRFVRENNVEVLYDDWPKFNKRRQYEEFGRRFNERAVHGRPFDVYKELYPRVEGHDRQHILCGRENGLGRANIFEYYYYGQQVFAECPAKA
jgi:hypothetical protein